MSSYLNFSVKTRDQFKNWIAISLGYPLTRVELHDLHYEQAINNSTEIFSKYVIQETEYFAFALSGYTQNVGYTLPDRIQSVFNISDQSSTMGSVNTLFSFGNQLLNAGMWPTSIDLVGSNFGLVQLEVSKQYVELLQRMCGGSFQADFNPVTKNLVLTPDPKAEKLDGWVVLSCNTLRPDEQIYGEAWCKRYALAVAKEYLGRIRKKIVLPNLLGGGAVDTSMLEEGLAEQEKLLEELKAEYPPGLMFFVG